MSTSFIRETGVPYKTWGREQIEPEAIQQMERATRLPIALRGALMPDAHLGYGLPIGGVLATDNAVIPYAVGVDIACRVRMTVFDVSPYVIGQKRKHLHKAIEENTVFGKGASWRTPPEHAVMDDPAWHTIAFAQERKDLAWRQLGTSGGGNHFVDFGALTVNEQIGDIPPGHYLALLSHSGSRRFGYEAANHYTKVAQRLQAYRLPKEYLHLAWLELGRDGDEYWAVMELAGRYASANHAVIHRGICAALRMDVLGSIENHHNFAWKEQVDGQEAVVHRKGATPAGAGVLGVIPGSMGTPGFIVRGKGSADGLNSAAHGAGRRMSRAAARKSFSWEQAGRKLKEAEVDLISGDLDEVPAAYKDIHRVMAAQADLVEPLAAFQPRIVKMAPGGKQARKKRSRDRKKRR